MGASGEFDELLAEVKQIQAAVLRCLAEPDDHGAPGTVEELARQAMDEGCPPRVMVAVLVRAFTGRPALPAPA